MSPPRQRLVDLLDLIGISITDDVSEYTIDDDEAINMTILSRDYHTFILSVTEDVPSPALKRVRDRVTRLRERLARAKRARRAS